MGIISIEGMDLTLNPIVSEEIQEKSNNLSMLYGYLRENKEKDKTMITERCLEAVEELFLYYETGYTPEEIVKKLEMLDEYHLEKGSKEKVRPWKQIIKLHRFIGEKMDEHIEEAWYEDQEYYEAWFDALSFSLGNDYSLINLDLPKEVRKELDNLE